MFGGPGERGDWCWTTRFEPGTAREVVHPDRQTSGRTEERKKNYHGVKKKEGKSYDSLICGVVSCDVTCKGDALRAASGSRGGRAGGVLGRAGGVLGH